MKRYSWLILIGFATASGAQPASFPEGGGRHFGPPHDGGRLFISPMGEPFRDAPDNAAAWFAAADADHDGRLTLAEFRSDALRFFALLDVDHDREIGPDEIDRYEQVIAPETGSGGGGFGGAGAAPGNRRGSGSGGGRGHAGGGRGGGGMGGGRGGMGGGREDGGQSPGGGGADTHTGAPDFDPAKQGAARYSYLALPEPVIAADADFNRGVSEQEFLQAASRRFALLDTDHDGIITEDELPRLGGQRAGPQGHQRRGQPRPTDD